MAVAAVLLIVCLAGTAITIALIARWHVASRRIAGLRTLISAEQRKAATPNAGDERWWTILRIAPTAAAEEIDAAYRSLAAAARARARRDGQAPDLTRLQEARREATRSIVR